MKRKYLILKTVFILMILLLLLSSCKKLESNQDLEDKLEIVNIGTQRIPNGEKIAIDKKYFEEEFGVKVNIIEFNAGDIRNALISKDIDFAHLGVSSAVLGIASGIEVEVIWIHEILGEAERLVAKNGSNIKSIKDLVGKKVATPFATTTHYSLLKALELYDISEEDLTIYDMQMPDVYAAWQRDDIDAAYAWEPTLSTLLEDGETILSSKTLAEQGITTSNVEIVRQDFAEKHPEIVIGYISAVNKSVELYKNNRDEAIKSIANQLSITEDEALTQSLGSIWLNAEEQLGVEYFGTSENKGELVTSLTNIADFLYDQKSLIKKPNVSVFEKAVNPMYIESIK